MAHPGRNTAPYRKTMDQNGVGLILKVPYIKCLQLWRNGAAENDLCKPHTQEFGLEIHSGEVTRKQPQQRLSLLHVAHLLVITNASTKHYQNMSKGIKVMERTRFWLQGKYYIEKKVRVVFLAYSCLLILLSISHIISNSMRIMACTRFLSSGKI